MSMLITLNVMLMAFTYLMWKAENETLAAGAGTAAIALTVEIARRLMSTPAGSSALPTLSAPPSSLLAPSTPVTPPAANSENDQ